MHYTPVLFIKLKFPSLSMYLYYTNFIGNIAYVENLENMVNNHLSDVSKTEQFA